MNRPRFYSPEILKRISELAVAEPQSEVCGLVVARSRAALEVVPIANLADRDRAAGPARPSCTAHSSFLMDPLHLLRVLEGVDVAGGEIAAVYHSHIETGAYLSSRDREAAVVGGIQQIPGAEYLVVSVKGGSVQELRRYLWDGWNFTERPL